MHGAARMATIDRTNGYIVMNGQCLPNSGTAAIYSLASVAIKSIASKDAHVEIVIGNSPPLPFVLECDASRAIKRRVVSNYFVLLFRIEDVFECAFHQIIFYFVRLFIMM